MAKKNSAQSDTDPYMKVGFYNDPKNHFWEQPAQTLVDRNGHVDQVLEWSPRAKEYFRKAAVEILKRSRYRLHSL
jgi:hypothetical protein